jgi:hypothetical protein
VRSSYIYAASFVHFTGEEINSYNIGIHYYL